MASSVPGADAAPVPSLDGAHPPPPPDAVMSDAPALTPNSHAPPRTTTPQRGAAAAPPPPVTAPAEAALPTKAPPHGAHCRQYLNEKVTGALLAGMKRVAAEQPEDPLRMLGEFLLAKSRELEGTS